MGVPAEYALRATKRLASEKRDELAPFHGFLRGEGRTLAYRCARTVLCDAAKWAAVWPLWVISLEGSRGRRSMHFRYSPKS